MHKPNHTQESDQLLRLGQKGGNFSNLGTRALRQCLCAHTQHPKLAKCWCNGTGKAPCALVRFAPKGGRGNLGPSVTGPTRAKIDQKGVQTHSRKIKLTRDSVLISNSTRLDSIKKKEGRARTVQRVPKSNEARAKQHILYHTRTTVRRVGPS